MIRRLFRLIVLAAAAAGVAAVVRALAARDDPLPAPVAGPTGGPWPPLRNESAPPEPVPATPPATETPSAAVVPQPAGVPVADEPAGSTAPWVEPTDGGACPDGHPLKANMKSMIFHSPGQLNYDRTTPDRCYVDVAAAEADGLRAAKR